jgi:SAM-dependent methyltransferase
MNDKLHLGSGSDILSGYVNLDFEKQPGVDVIHDLEQTPWPFEDNTFEEVVTNHTLEHLSDLAPIMKELWRVCKPGAIIRISVPHFSCGVSYRDPTHKQLFSYFSFDYFSGETSYYKHEDHALYEIVSRQLNFTRFAMPWLNPFINPIINLSPELYERFFCWIFPTSEVKFELRVLK